MAQHSLLTYIRLKLVAIIVRLVVRVTASNVDRIEAGKTRIHPARRQIPSRDPKRSIKVDIYERSDSSNTAPHLDKKPVLINWHGSGFVLPLHGTDALFCARTAENLDIAIVDADYRKAPEFPFPAAVEDVEDVLRWVESQGARFDLSRVAVSGFSAGGNLALVASSVLREKFSNLHVKGVAAFYPVTDLSIAPEAKVARKPVKPISASAARLFNDCYVPDVAVRRDPRVSVRLADPELFPETVVVVTCEGDNLEAEATSLAEGLRVDADRKVMCEMLDGVGHAFDKGCVEGSHEWRQRERAYDLVTEGLRGAFGL